jgi:putative ABC transport system permease protein
MMPLKDIFTYSWRSLRTANVRSNLTIIGVIIGIIALVVVNSISEGVQRDIRLQLAAFGDDKMFVAPFSNAGSSFSGGPVQSATSGKLFEKDAQAIEGIPGVKSVARMVYGRTSVEFKSKSITSTIYGTEDIYFDQWDNYLKISSGRLYRSGERGVVLLGDSAANEIFGKDKVAVGSILKINNHDYRVVGIFEKIGSSLSAADDSSIYIPYEDGKKEFGAFLSKNEINFIGVSLNDGYNQTEIKEQIEQKLASLHKVRLDEKDFTIINSDFINGTVGNILSILGVFLFLITMVASIVGGIGIMNTMFMGVLERVQEIGVLKAIGATSKDILLIFISESAVLGLIGGAIGLLLGSGILFISGNFGVPYWLRLRIILFAILFSMFIGILAGFIPSRQASKMDPVDALRYE